MKVIGKEIVNAEEINGGLKFGEESGLRSRVHWRRRGGRGGSAVAKWE